MPFDLAADLEALCAREPALAAVAARLPPLERRTCPPGVAGLAWMIVGQQVSVASARAVWARLEGALGEVGAESLARAEASVLRACGFSRPKIAYVQALAVSGFDPSSLAALSDAEAIRALTGIRGVGRWTAETFLMMGEGRGDLFPAGDIALQEALRWLERLPARPGPAAAAVLAERFAPHRSAAAHLLWAWYMAVKSAALPHPLT